MAKSKIIEAARTFNGAPPVEAFRPAPVQPTAGAVKAEARALGAAVRRAASPANQFILAPALDSPRPSARVPSGKELLLDSKRTAERYVTSRTAEPLDLDYRTGDAKTPFRQTPTPTNPSYRPAPAPAAGASGPRLKPGAGPARTSTLGRVANNAKTAAAAVTNSVAAGPGAVNTGFWDSGSSTSRAKIDKMGKVRQIVNGVYRAPESGPGVVSRTAGAVANGAGRVASGVKAAAAAQGTSGLGVADRLRAGLNAATAARPAATSAASAAQASLVRRGLGAVATGLGRVAGVAGRAYTPVMATMGAYKSGTMSGEDRARFNKDFGVTDSKSFAGDLANNTANVAFNVGNALFGGLPEKLGQGIGTWAGGGTFKEGWNGKTFDERATPKPAEAGGRAPGGGAWTPSMAPAGWGDQAKKDVAQQSSDDAAISKANALADQMQRRSAAGGLMVAPNNRYDPDAPVYASGASKDGGFYDKASPGTVIGQFNGRDITKAESEVRGGSLVTSSGPVAMDGKNGFAASTGRSLAQQAASGGSPNPTQAAGSSMPATGGRGGGGAGGQPTMQRRNEQVGDSFGGYGGFRGSNSRDPQAPNIRGDLFGADSERRGAIENIDAAIKSLSTENGGLNMRSKREIYARLLEQRSDMASMPYDVQNTRDLAGAKMATDVATSNADRGLERDKFQWDQDKFGIERQDKIAADEAARNAPPSAKELREDATFRYNEKNLRDKDGRARVADMAAQIAAETGSEKILPEHTAAAQERYAEQLKATDRQSDDSSSVLGQRIKQGRIAGVLNTQPWTGFMGDAQDNLTADQIAPADIAAGLYKPQRRSGIGGLAGYIPGTDNVIPDYELVGPGGPNGTQRRGLYTEAQKSKLDADLQFFRDKYKQ